MATSAITNTIKDASGTAVSGVVVTARLRPGPGFRVGDATEVAGQVATTTNGSGVWTLNLERVANITPTNSYWEVEEDIPEAQGGRKTYAITVGSVGATLYASLLNGLLPATTTPTALTQTAGDARYWPIGALNTFSAAAYGASGDGVANDRTAIAAADAAAASAGGQLHFPPGTYNVTSNLSIVSPILFAPGAKLKVPTGITVTINGTVSAPDNVQIFTLAGTGAIRFVDASGGGASQSAVFGEWFGARGDNAVTNDSAALQAALNSITRGYLQLLGKSYAVGTALAITTDNVGIRGVGMNSSYLIATGDNHCITVTGPGTGTYVSYNHFRDFALSRTATPTNGRGVSLSWTAHFLAENVLVNDSYIGWYLADTTSSNFEHCTVTRSLGSSGSAYGWYLDGSSTHTNYSCRAESCLTHMLGFTTNGGTGHGLYSVGTIQDLFLLNFETAYVAYGIYLDAITTGNYDVHIIKPIIDLFTTKGIWITGAAAPAGGAGGAISIVGGWTNAQLSDTPAATDNIRVELSRGVTITGGHQFFGGPNYARATGLNVVSSNQVVCSGNIFKDFKHPVVLTSAAASAVLGNSIWNPAVQTADIAVNLAGSSRNNIIGNTVDGESAGVIGTGIKLDNSSDYNNVGPNVINPGAVTTVHDLGTATHNVVTGVVT